MVFDSGDIVVYEKVITVITVITVSLWFLLQVQDALKSYRSETENKADSDNDETEDLGPEDINQTAIMIKGITPFNTVT